MKRFPIVLAVAAWLAAIATSVLADGVVDAGGFSFTWGQVAMLVAIGAAWGDLRRTVREHDPRIRKLERDVASIREALRFPHGTPQRDRALTRHSED